MTAKTKTEHPDVQKLIIQIVKLNAKNRELKEALQNLVNDVFAGRTPMPKHLYAYKQATKALLKANSKEKPLGAEMADAFDKIVETLAICL